MSEEDCFIIEAAYQKGFSPLGDDGEYIIASNEAFVAFVKLVKEQAESAALRKAGRNG